MAKISVFIGKTSRGGIRQMATREFGERLCERTASDWPAAQLEDGTSRSAVEFILAGVSVGDITERMK